MRFAIILLVIANVLLFVAGGGLSAGGPAQPAGDGNELSPERIRIISRSEPPSIPPASPAPSVGANGVTPATGSSGSSAGLAASSVAVADVACLVWPELAVAQVSRIASASQANGVLLTRETMVTESTRWWVHIPPLASGKAGAEKKSAELRRLGIKRFTVIEEEGEGENRYAISFGRFDSEPDARKVLDNLRKKNVRSAQITSQGAGDGRERVIARGPAVSLEALRLALPDTAPETCPPSASAAPPPAPKP